MGGPETTDEVFDFLNHFFSDKDIMPLQSQKSFYYSSSYSNYTRTIYKNCGGGSPIKMETEKQGQGMIEILDQISPSTDMELFIPDILIMRKSLPGFL
ncbi:unnamed protein product [Rotaria sp. Silwood2]|nr:unnamed protein product [Rotaria sp. Silwood2]